MKLLKKYSLPISAGVILLLGSCIFFYKNITSVKVKSHNNDSADAAAHDVSIYRGIVTAGSNECVVDGVCALTIDKVFYIAISSGREMLEKSQKQLSANQLQGFDVYDLQTLVGKKVEIHIVGYDFTLKQKFRNQYPGTDDIPAYLDLKDDPRNYIKKLD
jgi:hypothetical protein